MSRCHPDLFTAENNEEWLQRLKDRRSETEEELALRVKTAQKEFETLDIFDYIVVNQKDKLGQTLDVIESIIKAEHHRVNPRKVQF